MLSASSTDAVSMSVENWSTIGWVSGTSPAFGAGWLPTTVGWPTVTKASWEGAVMRLPAGSRTPTAIRTTKSVCSGRRSAGVKVIVAPVQLKAPVTPGAMEKAACALA